MYHAMVKYNRSPAGNHKKGTKQQKKILKLGGGAQLILYQQERVVQDGAPSKHTRGSCPNSFSILTIALNGAIAG